MGYNIYSNIACPNRRCYRKYWRTKIFITKKFTQCKTSCTLKIEVIERRHNKNIIKLFSKYELPFLDQSSSDPSQILILQNSILRTFLPPSSFLSNPIQLKALLNIILIMFFIGLSIFS